MLNVNNPSRRKNEEATTICQPNDFACTKRGLQEAEIHEEPVPKKRKVKKRVSIAEENEIKHCARYTDEDIREAWCNDFDYSIFKIECLYTVMTIRFVKGDLAKLDPSIICTRGLESHLGRRISSVNRTRRRVALIQMVLNQQNINRVVGNESSCGLRLISEKLSQDATFMAIVLGQLDKQDSLY
jgi:hypothetical protein